MRKHSFRTKPSRFSSALTAVADHDWPSAFLSPGEIMAKSLRVANCVKKIAPVSVEDGDRRIWCNWGSSDLTVTARVDLQNAKPFTHPE
jgi:hypothetical protein